jgi:hypothetical protein
MRQIKLQNFRPFVGYSVISGIFYLRFSLLDGLKNILLIFGKYSQILHVFNLSDGG